MFVKRLEKFGQFFDIYKGTKKGVLKHSVEVFEEIIDSIDTACKKKENSKAIIKKTDKNKSLAKVERPQEKYSNIGPVIFDKHKQ